MIKETNVEGEDVVRHGQLNLVDLAGSECVGRSGAKNDRAREAGSINQSLLTLGRVITALVDHHGHIPYRDSKLTRILQESLGGRAKTCIIATLSPSQLAVDESVSTLDYAYRAKNIKNRPEVNQKMTKKVLLKEYGAEIENLRLMLQMTREKNGVYLAPAQYDAMEQRIAAQEAQISECESALRSRTEDLKQLRSEREVIDEQIRVAQLEIETKTSELERVTSDLQQTVEDLTKTKVELFASNAVIDEQVETESSLSNEGTYMQSRILSHRSDISGLFDKVDRHVVMEQRRITEADTFRSGVANLQDSVLVEIGNMQGVNQKHTEELCSGVSTLLAKGRDTCSSLQTAIDGALGVLVADAGASRDKMTASCSALEISLTTMRNEATVSLAGLKEKLVAWIGQAETEMTRVIDHMQLQKQEVCPLKPQYILTLCSSCFLCC
jgi:kinesin family protein 11